MHERLVGARLGNGSPAERSPTSPDPRAERRHAPGVDVVVGHSLSFARDARDAVHPLLQSGPPLPWSVMVAAAAEQIERRHYALAGLRAAFEAALLVFVYFVIPINHHHRSYVVLRITVGARAIRRDARLRGAGDPALPAPDAPRRGCDGARAPAVHPRVRVDLFTMSLSSPLAFNQRLTRISALYFTVTVSRPSASATSSREPTPARLAVTVQMVLDLAVIAVVVRLILGAARRIISQREAAPDG